MMHIRPEPEDLSHLLWFDPLFITGNITGGGARGKIKSTFKQYLVEELKLQDRLSYVDDIDSVAKSSLIFPTTKKFQKFLKKPVTIKSQVEMYSFFADEICTRMRNVPYLQDEAKSYAQDSVTMKRVQDVMIREDMFEDMESSLYEKFQSLFTKPRNLFLELDNSVRTAFFTMGCIDLSTNIEQTDLPIFASYAIDRNYIRQQDIETTIKELLSIMKINSVRSESENFFYNTLSSAVIDWTYHKRS